jgi:NADH dehydrogenase
MRRGQASLLQNLPQLDRNVAGQVRPEVSALSFVPSETLVTVIGGSGFIGRHIVRALARRGYRIRPASRRPDLAGHLQPLGTPGQIMPVQANVRFPASLAAACEGASVVIYLPAVLFESGGQNFEALHVFGAEAAAKAARAARARMFIHMSAIGADTNSASAYARTKAEGEARVKAAFPGAIVIRPSVVFGPEDDLFNRFAAMARLAPALPLIGGGETKFAPVFVGDVAEAFARLIDQGIASGRTYELGGPEVMSLKDIIAFTLKTTKRHRLLVNLPWRMASLLASVMGLFPKPMLTADQVELLKHHNLVSDEARREGRTLEALGIKPSGVEAIVPAYLYRYRRAGQFSAPENAGS